MALWIHSGRASWTDSCEYFRYPTIPSLSWREPLEPGVAPTTPDDWFTAQARSPARVRPYTSDGAAVLELVPIVRVHAVTRLVHYSVTLMKTTRHQGEHINRLSPRRIPIKQFIQEPLGLMYTQEPDVLFHS